MDSKNIKYLTIVPFAVVAILSFVNLVQWVSIYNVLDMVGIVLVIVGIVISKPIFSMGGFLLFALCDAISFGRNLSYYIDEAIWEISTKGEYGFYYLETTIILILTIVTFILLAIAAVKLNSAKTISMIATGTLTARFLLILIRNISEGYGVAFITIIWCIMYILCAISFGLICDNFNKDGFEFIPKGTAKTVKNKSVKQLTTEETTVEKLIKLKNLLDMGAINQEEFDAKKKQLLGL